VVLDLKSGQNGGQKVKHKQCTLKLMEKEISTLEMTAMVYITALNDTNRCRPETL